MIKQYRKSEKNRAATERYRKSKKGRATLKRYRQTTEYKKYQADYYLNYLKKKRRYKLTMIRKRSLINAKRFLKLISHRRYTSQDIARGICAVHTNSLRLDLNKFLSAKDHIIAHDVYNIMWYLYGSIAELSGRFLPQCAEEQKTPR